MHQKSIFLLTPLWGAFWGEGLVTFLSTPVPTCLACDANAGYHEMRILRPLAYTGTRHWLAIRTTLLRREVGGGKLS